LSRLELKTTLAPIIVAMLVLVSVGMLGLAVVWWVNDPTAEAVRAFRDQATPADPSSCADDCFTPSRDVPKPKWM
jgi:hypothetical protein